ncbi:putative prolyl 4-hydroxylase 3 [Phytophthora citrophthora]|uniref:Prolyl 4-hydroxylase 3 n=1 Tax=Phytophthora citrophthora TaxID=4793 RepID=A0AAD9G829_9STRA|nr:putative prolyl 4-hydroxylase 3 [Phytophthora citrophthora]
MATSFTWLAVALLAIVVATFTRDPKALELVVHRLLSDTNLVDVRSAVNCSDAHQFLTDMMPVKGFHVLCIETAADVLKVTGFKDGMHGNRSVETTKDLTEFTNAVERDLLQIPEPSDEYARKYKQPPAYFTVEGEKLEKTISALENRIVFLFEGGQFIWPGIRIGHKTLVKNTFGRGDLVLETISMTPLVFSVEEFLRDEEIDVILELSMPHLAPSGVTLQDGHENRPSTDWRTSTTYWLDSSSHSVVQDIDKRTADLVKVPLSHQESVQVLRYERTQHYDQHLDYFSVDHHQHSPDVLEQIEYGYKNRMITVFWYMSDVAKGGHTNFSRAGGLPHPPSNKGCPQGISVAPKKRKVVVFYSMLPNGKGDPMSLHAGCPVEEGIKLSGNKWVWNKPLSDDD